MKILVVSDSHGKDRNIVRALEQERPIDQMIHLGDSEGSEDYIREIAECPLEIVSGNNDFFSDLEKEKEIQIGPYKTLITHGHYYYVSLEKKSLFEIAKSRGIQIAMFGHTHRPYIEEQDGILLLNPGSISYPRQEGRKPSYMVLELDEKNEIHIKTKFFK